MTRTSRRAWTSLLVVVVPIALAILAIPGVALALIIINGDGGY